ncbi:Hpt domain-containing protein [Bradyrhizobium sp. cf659]|uniref:Hpt domain-containing protein n=1 Tax=Bradyrhizobium sp. cf659 TaxID=1761771 RepID=UPI000B89EA82|nr:Hpt domain-containing protein [Bradyrhizobium sp. cf659]
MAQQLSRKFSQPVSPTYREDLSREAHAFAGPTGMLGFNELAEACAALQTDVHDGSPLDPFLPSAATRDAALRAIAEMVIDNKFANPARQRLEDFETYNLA